MNLLDILKEYLSSLETAQKWTPQEKEHNLEFYAKKIHKLYVDAVDKLI